MDKSFHQGNRQKFYDSLENGTIALFFQDTHSARLRMNSSRSTRTGILYI